MSTQTAAILFAKELIDWVWDDGPSTEESQAVLDMATAKGLIQWRKPTAAELADDEWWGHGYDIGPNDSEVGEYTPAFRAAISEAMGKTA
jgi:hypothetical protein